ncbi:HAMP domain-containing sensor histidine kinase [Luteimonas vadosa]|uniref:histidine kinase n=1 Tax=Luteimonas vadosa TaxID=1165507 RepID=A0ABP9E1J2_9GAMM
MSANRSRHWMHRLAHDLRGPLSPMQVAIYLLRDESLAQGERNELFAVLERQIARLDGMIHEISDLGRAEQGRMLTRLEPLDLQLLIEHLSSQLEANPPEITYAPDAGAIELEGDAVRLGQLLKSLLGLRTSRTQQAPVRAHVDWAAPDRMRMHCTITSPGAQADFAEALLAGPHPEPPDEGLGLGLMIASAIAEAHGGRLDAGDGTDESIEFVLELPARPAS